ncbi:MAG: hypothetical protein IKB16_05180 [Lentisphaeria bacterium]|nr:hypothetical protein [Lentisphaeria bacterium]
MLNLTINQSLQKEFEKRDHLSNLFPGIHCGNPDCAAQCADALEVARKLNLNEKDHLLTVIEEKIVPEYGCQKTVAPTDKKSCCRFGYAIPGARAFFDTADATITGSVVEYVEAYVFDASQENCEKCQAKDGISVTPEQKLDENFMKNLGFYLQEDGVYRPHPNCKCVWKEVKRTVDLSDYSWEKTNSAALATYTITVPIPNFYLADNLVAELAKIVRLDVHEASNWMQNVKVQPVGKQTTISVDVPNVWLCIDLMQGWAQWWKDPILNIGGTIGQAVSYLTTYGMEEVFCYSIDEMYSAFKTYQHQIWGFVLYAHGDKIGGIHESNGKHHTTQAKLMSAVDQQGYKLAKVYLMQCYSGTNGIIELKFSYKELIEVFQEKNGEAAANSWKNHRKEFMQQMFIIYEKYYQDKIAEQSNILTYIGGTWNEDEIILRISSKMGEVWDQKTVNNKLNISYQGANFAVIDWWFLDKNLKIKKDEP